MKPIDYRNPEAKTLTVQNSLKNKVLLWWHNDCIKTWKKQQGKL